MTRQRRAYISHKRAQEAEATRTYILDATCDLLVSKGYPNFSVDDIAARAGVARATIYVHFGSKSGVLQAVAHRLDDRALENLMPDLLAAKDRKAAFRAALHRIFAFFGQNGDLLRSLQAQMVYDPDYAEQERSHRQEIWRNARKIVEWLAKEKPQVSVQIVDRAADWLWALSSFEMYDKLVIERGRSAEEMVGEIIRSVEDMLGSKSDERS